MKKSNRKYNGSSKRRLLWALAAILALAAIVAVLELTDTTHWFHKSANSSTNQGASNGVNYGPPTDEEKQAGNQNPAKGLDDSSPAPQPTTSNNDVVISRASQDGPGKPLVVQTKLYGSGWKSCKLTLSQGQQKIVKTVDVLYQPEFSTCLGYSIEASEFSSSGTWYLVLEVTKSDGSNSAAPGQDVIINK
ncbi:MAG TPA: hypothetical protein VLG37_03290 [Candidatus Saccharimonadales bacterium]|nr:hypothetical protein [Candidatus Saccharimonadales bacterium]